MPNITRFFFSAFFLTTLISGFADAKVLHDDRSPQAIMGNALWQEAMSAYAAHEDHVSNDDYMIVIDYRRHSGEPRFFLIDMEEKTAEAYLVSHGRASDPDHDGLADRFSNVSGSKMSSLGSFVTAETYYGKHGLSLRLDGLESQNAAARERAIVIHGADYVDANRSKMGRSWGCPSLEQHVAADLIPKIADGVLIYTRGPEAEDELYADIVDKAG